MEPIKTNYTIIKVTTKQEYDVVKELFRAYQKELDKDLSFQSFEEELQRLPQIYHKSNGALLLLKDLADHKYVGCIGLKKLKPNICEMKRLYVIPQYRYKKYGLKLVNAILLIARDLTYHEIWLDTLKELKPALNLYKKLGFTEMEAYYDNPYEDVVFMRKELK